MMTDCHGLPFVCMVKKQRTESLMDQSQTHYRNTQDQNEASKSMAATLYRQQNKITNNGGYNPSDMSAILKQNSNIFNNNKNTESGQSNFMNKYVLSGGSYHENGNTKDSIKNNNIQSSRNADLNSQMGRSRLLTDNSNSFSSNRLTNSLSRNGLSGSSFGLGMLNSGKIGSMVFQGGGTNSGNTIGTGGQNFFQKGIMSHGFVNRVVPNRGMSQDSINRGQVVSSQSGDQGLS